MSKFFCVYCTDGRHAKDARDYLEKNKYSQRLICDTNPRPSVFPAAFKNARFGLAGITIAVCWLKPEHQKNFIDLAVFHPEFAWYVEIAPPPQQQQFCIQYFVTRLGRARCGLPPIIEPRSIPMSADDITRERLIAAIEDHEKQQPHDYKWTLDHRRLEHQLEVFDEQHGRTQTVWGITNPQDMMNPLADGLHWGLVPFKKSKHF